MPFNDRNILQSLDLTRAGIQDAGAAGVFGLCCSILTWSGVGKNVSPLRPETWSKLAGKLLEDGHETTFLYQCVNNKLTMTGIADRSWVFDSGTLGDYQWARNTTSSTTFVYYIFVDNEFIDRYKTLKRTLKRTDTAYAVVWPNLWTAKTTYHNCVSHGHYLISQLGLNFFNEQVAGWWMPSVGNWVEWLKSFVPTYKGDYRWRYRRLENTNTHIP